MTDVLTRTTFSVIICAYTEQRWDDIVEAVASVENQTLPAHELVLVIDHNPTLFRRARAVFWRAVVVENDGPKGLSGARNTGVATAEGDVVAFLDDDAVAAPDWLEQLAASFEAPDVVGSGGLVIPAWDGARPGWFPEEFDWVVGCSHSGMPRSTHVVRNFVGANMAFRRVPLIGLGGFSPVLGRTGANAAGCEETELCIRAAGFEGGSRLLYEPRAMVRHHVPTERGTWHYFFRRCYAEGQSKAAVTALTGTGDGLSSERDYLRRTVPRAIVRALVDGITSNPRHLLRAFALVAGTSVTAAGYLGATIAKRSKPAPARPDSLPGRAGSSGGPDDRDATVSPASRRGALVLGGVVPLLAVVLWAVALTGSRPPEQMDDLGLLSILSPAYFAALGLTIVGFLGSLRLRRLSTVALVVNLVVLLAIVHLTPQILYGTLRYTWAWKHVAITNFVVQTHGVQLNQDIPSLVAYQDWPGFFTLNALLTSASGFASAIAYAPWGPFVNELSYAAPLMAIFRTFPVSRRSRWLALLLFYFGNWIGQDYFSPQGFGFFLYLVVIAVVLRHFRTASAETDPEAVRAGVHRAHSPRQERLLLAVCVLILFAIASSHQLTPFMALAGLVALVLFKTLRRRSLPVAAAVVAFGWIALAARTFIADNGPSVLQGFGALLSNAEVNQVNVAQASADQLLVSKFDRYLTAGIILLAVIGFFRTRIRLRDRRWLPAMLLTVAPGFALAANSYGGEVVFRVFLFALPFLALFAAQGIGGHRIATAGVAGMAGRLATVGLIAVAFLFSYYGKERANYYSPNEVSSIARFYSMIPAGSTITGIAGNDPWPETGYQNYQYYWFTQVSPTAAADLVARPVSTLLSTIGSAPHAYVLFSESDAAQVEMTGQLPRGAFGDIEHAVLASGDFTVVLSTPTVLALTPKVHEASVPAPAAVPLRATASSNQGGGA